MILLGIGGVGTAGWAYYDAWSTWQAWEASAEAEALARQAAVPTPVWIQQVTPEPFAARVEPVPTPAASVPMAGASVALVPVPIATRTAAADQLSLEATDFRFLDPPEPGAHARVAVTVANLADVPSGRVLLGIPSDWFESYTIIGTAPAVSADQTNAAGLRTFSFPPVPAGWAARFEVHVAATGEGTQAPSVKALLEGGDLIGEIARPQTFAPQPRPGPVMALDIPRLKLKSRVVQTAWEPPPFVIGQIKGSANITQGNTILIGHLAGAGGNVFAHLDQLQPGDEITTTSRGLPYKFVVSRTFGSSNTDAVPMQPAEEARLTLMTCAGLWNPFTHDYPERLWVIAEPPEQAAATIATAAATATAVAEATATAVAAEPTPTPVPTPFKGEPSLAGGIGNTRRNLEKTFGKPAGETLGKMVVFLQPGREFHVQFTPDPPRAALVAEFPASPLTFEAAVRESRKLFPSDTAPRAAAPEGNTQFVVERFTSVSLGEALGATDFLVLYTRDAKGMITSIILGLGDDFGTLIDQSRR